MKTPLKTVLKNFLDHYEDLELRRNLGDDQYETEFQELKKLTDKLKEDPNYPCSCGLKDVNRPKNRYKDIVPYDFSRVILPKYEGVPGSDYINASYVKGASGAYAYIAAQGPLPNTIIDFWRMIWICDVQVVVMACNEREAGKFKCEAYWPNPGEVKNYGNIFIELINTLQVCPDFMVRTLLVKCGSEMRDVYQFHYTSWPDHGAPDVVQPILDLVRLMRDTQASETVPIVVHCSAGCGRTGTICAVDYVWACLRQGKLDEDFSLYQISLELRRQRIAMIQTKEQYILAHKAVAAMFEQQLKVIDCHIYENIDEDGEPLMWKEVGKDKEFILTDSNIKYETNNKTEVIEIDQKKTELSCESNVGTQLSSNQTENIQASSTDTLSHNSSTGNNLNSKVADSVNCSSKNSESSYSRNSILSQQSTEDSIPFIDEDDICVRPHCGRAYLDIPSCDSISKLVNCFDPFVDKVSLGTDDSSPEGDPVEINKKMKDFQLVPTTKTLDKNTKIFNFIESKCIEEKDIKQLDSKSDVIDCSDKMKKQSLLSNRESYPLCSNNEKYQNSAANSVMEDEANENSEDSKSDKKVGKATVVRRPSISKLKALFEKSGLSSQKNSNDGSKRLLFRNNSHHVSRAGSAPPSLNCMDKNSAVEKESILMMVTRKFRSSSVRTERELQSKQADRAMNRRSASETVKDGLNALTRTMSFSINKTFKSYSPAKTKSDNKKNVSSNSGENMIGTYKLKSPDQPRGNSMWYDKSSLPRAIAIVKPTGKFETPTEPKIPSKSPPPPKTPEKNKQHEPHFHYVGRPVKFRDFFSNLNKKDARDSSTLWYNETNINTAPEMESISQSNVNSDGANLFTKSTNKVLPFLPISPWKKVGQRSPLSSPDSPKNLNELPTQPNSKFYTNISVDKPITVDVPSEKHSKIDVPTAGNLPVVKPSEIEMPKCPVPEEIIPLNLNSSNNTFWPSNSLSSSELTKPESKSSNSNVSVKSENVSEQSVIVDAVKEEKTSVVNYIPPSNAVREEKATVVNDIPPTNAIKEEKATVVNDIPSANAVKEEKTTIINDIPSTTAVKEETTTVVNDIPSANAVKEEKTTAVNDIPPAIPKKMIIGKNKNVQNILSASHIEQQGQTQQINEIVEKNMSETKENSGKEAECNIPEEKSDLYINVNIKAKKNLEQIENALRKCPRGAIIDLTSRESYSMEEELVNAVNQLSESSEKSKLNMVPCTEIFEKSEDKEKNKSPIVKNNSKFPGYEVIWPEQQNVSLIQKSKSSSKVPQMLNSKPADNTDSSLSNQKTGVCYSPPLRRSLNASLALAKSQSCGNLGWLEPDDAVSGLKETSNTPTKRLVNEAVVELNTLLNQLTTRTLSEDVDFNSKTKEKLPVNNAVNKNTEEKSKTGEEFKACNIKQNDTVVHSVTLVTKSYQSGSSPKEEEIVFHFPPPPRVPPPKDEPPVEKFNIVKKDGSLLVRESNKDSSTSCKSDWYCSSKKEDSKGVVHKNCTELPQPTPRKSKQASGLRRSSSYTNISPPQNKNKGYENIFLEKYQTLSKLQIKPELFDPDILDKTVPIQKSPIMYKTSNSKKSPGYVNVRDVPFPDLSNPPNVKSNIITQVKEYRKSEGGSNEHINTSLNVDSSSVTSQIPSKIIIGEVNVGNSVYGKINKISDKVQTPEKSQVASNVNQIKINGEIKKKPVPSKKTEKAPLPPNVKPPQIVSNEVSLKANPSNSMIPKRLPSRKLEKAPPPPQLLQKSFSSVNVLKKNFQSSQPYVNFPPGHQVEEKHKLPAVHENVPNVADNAKELKNKDTKSVFTDKFVNRGLSHSQSDVSVYLALKERRIQSANQERKILNMKSLLLDRKTKQNNESVSMSSSDSDSSFERIFQTKNNEQKSDPPKYISKEQIDHSSSRSYKKEVPVAPPRSKRRSTMEVQYTKVKAKDASLTSPTSEILPEENETKNSKITSVTEDEPPAIPVKTKDAFQIPEEISATGMNIKDEEKQRRTLPNMKFCQ